MSRVPVFRTTAVAFALVLGILNAGRAMPVPAQDASPVPVTDSTPLPVGALTSPWLQLGPDEALIARIVVNGDCPVITIDGSDGPMDVHAVPADGFPDTVCQANVPSAAVNVSVDGTALRMPSRDPGRVLVLGDTGCRLSHWVDDYQACNDPGLWPFATVAENGVGWAPDLIVHVGDYNYREDPCPEDEEGCTGSPVGDNWSAWNADFFEPAANLLPAAPWIFLRGNHEACGRNSVGWFRYLDPGAVPAECRAFTQPWTTHIGETQLIVMDSAAASDSKPADDAEKEFRQEFAWIAKHLDGSPAWLLTHRPFYSIELGHAIPTGLWQTATYTGAGIVSVPGGFDLILSGHDHNTQLLDFTDGSDLATQIIAGAGGTELDIGPDGRFDGEELQDPDLLVAQEWESWAMVTLEETDNGWVATIVDDANQPVATCLLIGTATTCIP